MQELLEKIQSNEPAWLSGMRQEAWHTFEQIPMPQRNEEDWRRTDLRGLRLDDFGLTSVETVSEKPGWYEPEEGYAGYQLNHDSALAYQQADLPEGVIFTSLSDAAKTHPELVKPYLGTQVPSDLNRLSALNTALWQGGSFLYVPRGVELEQPLQVVTSLQTPGRAVLSRTLIVIEENASASVVSEWISRIPDSAALHSGVTEIFVKQNARLAYHDLQNLNRRTWDFNVQRSRIDRDSHLYWFSGVLGSRLCKNYREVYLVGERADAEMRSLFLANGRQHMDIQTYQAHEAERTTSNLLYKGVLAEKSRTVFRGMIRVEPEGQLTDAYQTNRNLLLSPDARADSIPGLEIEADDVRCSHSAAASPIDPDQVFYLMSRGISRGDAHRMLVYGFADDVLVQIKPAAVREKLDQAISQLLLA